MSQKGYRKIFLRDSVKHRMNCIAFGCELLWWICELITVFFTCLRILPANRILVNKHSIRSYFSANLMPNSNFEWKKSVCFQWHLESDRNAQNSDLKHPWDKHFFAWNHTNFVLNYGKIFFQSNVAKSF